MERSATKRTTRSFGRRSSRASLRVSHVLRTDPLLVFTIAQRTSDFKVVIAELLIGILLFLLVVMDGFPSVESLL